MKELYISKKRKEKTRIRKENKRKEKCPMKSHAIAIGTLDEN